MVEDGQTRITWSLLKKGYSMIGILQNRGVSSEVFSREFSWQAKKPE